jgi:hypothetical protein
VIHLSSPSPAPSTGSPKIAVYPASKAWASEDIATLRGMASQLKDGQATAEHLFPVLEAKKEPEAEPKGKRGRPAKTERPKSPPAAANLLPRSPTPEQLAVIRLTCLEKDIDMALILKEQQVSALEELDYDRAQQLVEWLKSQ